MKLLSTFTLRQWLTIPFTVLMFSVAVLIGVLSYFTGSQAVDTISKNLLQETVARIGQAVDRHVVGSAAVLEAAFPNGMAAPERIDADLAAMRTRFWIATSLHTDPNNFVYYGNRNGQAFGLWRFNQQDAELRYKLQADQPRQFSRFSGIDGPLQSPTFEKRYSIREHAPGSKPEKPARPTHGHPSTSTSPPPIWWPHGRAACSIHRAVCKAWWRPICRFNGSMSLSRN
jgi:hypothetical protein